MPEPRSYARRFFARASRETAKFSRQKLIVGPCVAIIAITVRLLLLWFHHLKVTWADTWNDLIIVVSSYATVLLGSFFVNLFRAPGLLDQDRADEIAGLTGRLGLIELSQGPRELTRKLAFLMKQEAEIRGHLESAPNGAEFTKYLGEHKRWIAQMIALLNDAELHTDAEAFSQIGNMAPSTAQVAGIHLVEWKRYEVARVHLYRDKLDQIMSNRRL
jgi:hypothetical protein